ncbi:hypothetical protein ACFL37_01665 [Candidatus Margulisiibacteriota bacterium]
MAAISRGMGLSAFRARRRLPVIRNRARLGSRLNNLLNRALGFRNRADRLVDFMSRSIFNPMYRSIALRDDAVFDAVIRKAAKSAIEALGGQPTKEEFQAMGRQVMERVKRERGE